MDQTEIKRFFFGFFIAYGAISLLEDIFSFFARKHSRSDEERFWESDPFEDTLEKADDFCEIGYTFQKNEIIYKKISEKTWFVEILIPVDDDFEIGCELTIENYVYKKLVKSLGRLRGVTIKNFIHIDIPCKKLTPFRLSVKLLHSVELSFSGLTLQQWLSKWPGISFSLLLKMKLS